ncbi:MAG: urea carboxylase-associated family protein [Blastochloris sp.]|nr:urea carboxylase-associated family protein [Blastochloris sp.]
MSTPFAATPDVEESRVRFREIVPGGSNWSHVLKRGTTLRLVDVKGGANVSALFFNFELLTERYNMSDTLKAQHVAKLSAGCALYSDMGRILVSLTQDTYGWHDTLGGHSTASMVEKNFGNKTFQEARNQMHRNGRDQFLMELGKYGLGLRDLVPNVNFFSKVGIGAGGEMIFDTSLRKAGAWVDLRSEMNTLVVLNTCMHPLDPAPSYDPKPVHLMVWESPVPGPEDRVRCACPENGRGFTLTERYFM